MATALGRPVASLSIVHHTSYAPNNTNLSQIELAHILQGVTHQLVLELPSILSQSRVL